MSSYSNFALFPALVKLILLVVYAFSSEVDNLMRKNVDIYDSKYECDTKYNV